MRLRGNAIYAARAAGGVRPRNYSTSNQLLFCRAIGVME